MTNLVVIKRGHSPAQVRELLRTSVDDALASPTKELLIDLTDLDVITSAILKCLLRPRVIDLAVADKVIVRTSTPEVTRVLAAYRLSKLFDVKQGGSQ